MKRVLLLLMVSFIFGNVTFARKDEKDIKKNQTKASEYVLIDPLPSSGVKAKNIKRINTGNAHGKEKARGMTSWEYADPNANATILGYLNSNKLEYMIARWDHPELDTVTYSATLLGWINSSDFYEDLIIPNTVNYNGISVPVTAVNPKAFYYGTGLRTLSIGKNVIGILEASFFGCNFREVTIPTKVEMILSEAFSNNFLLEEVKFDNPSAIFPDLILGNYCFAYTRIKELEIPARLQVHHPLSFTYLNGSLAPLCMSLAKITINSNYKNKKLRTRAETEENSQNYLDLEIIGDALYFNGVDPQTNQKICNVVQYPAGMVGNNLSVESDIIEVFEGALAGAQLDKVSLTAKANANQETQNLKLWDSSFEQSAISTLELNANGKIDISAYALNGCYRLSEVKLSDGVTNYNVNDGVIYEKDGDNLNLACYPAGKSDQSFTIPSKVKNIREYAFATNSYLESLKITSTIDTIGYAAFSVCTNLRSIDYSGGPIEHIGKYAFYYTKIIESAPEGEVLLSNWLIGYNGTVPENYVMSNNITRAMPSIFAGNTNIKTVSFPDDFESIPTEAFIACYNFEKVVKWPENLKVIEPGAFYYCGYDVAGNQSGTIDFPSGLLAVGEYAFYQSNFFDRVIFPLSIIEVDGYSFVTRYDLKEVELNKNEPPYNYYPEYPIFTDLTLVQGLLKIPQEADPQLFRDTAGWNFLNIVQSELDAVESIDMEADNITIDGNSIYSNEGAEFEIYDTAGRLIGKGTHVYGLSHGIYILKSGNKTFKIFI